MVKIQRSESRAISEHAYGGRGRAPDDPILRQLRMDWAAEVVSRTNRNHAAADRRIFSETPTGRLFVGRVKRFTENLCKGKDAGRYAGIDFDKLVDEVEVLEKFTHTKRRYYRPIYRFLLSPPKTIEELDVLLNSCFRKFGVSRMSRSRYLECLEARRFMRTWRDPYAAPVEHNARLFHEIANEGTLIDERRSIGSCLVFTSALYYEAMFAMDIRAMAELRTIGEKLVNDRGRMLREFGNGGSELLRAEISRRVFHLIFLRNNQFEPFPSLKREVIGGVLLRNEEIMDLEAEIVKQDRYLDAMEKVTNDLIAKRTRT